MTLSQTINKECDGTFHLYPHNEEKVTMYLVNSNKNNEPLYCSFTTKNGTIIHSEYLHSSKKVFFDDLSFYVYGKKYFTTENESTSRFGEMKKYFEANFNKTIKHYYFENNRYEGETIDNSTNMPSGFGTLFYESSNNIMIKGNFLKGMPDGTCSFFTKDQSIELICDDVMCKDGNIIPLQKGTVYFKNIKKELKIDFILFRENKHNRHTILNYKNTNQYIMDCVAFVTNYQQINEILFKNLDQAHQYYQLFNLMTEYIENQHKHTKSEHTTIMMIYNNVKYYLSLIINIWIVMFFMKIFW